MIKFDSVEEKELLAFKGGEGALNAKMLTDELNKILMGRLEPGSSIGLHTHEDSCETIFILSGKGSILEIEDGQETMKDVKSGDCLFCAKGHSHSLRNTSDSEDLIFYASVIQL